MAEKTEITIPVADPNDPYAVPAAMPSSADRAPRSFDLDAFAMPTSRQEEWRYTPLDRVSEFLDVFEPSGLTTVEVTGIDGSPLDPAQVGVEVVDRTVAPSGTVSKPSDRISAVEWNVVKTATVVTLHGDVDQPVRISVTGGGMDLDALHLVIVADAGTHADVVVEHHGTARLAEGVEIVTGRDSNLSTTFIQEWEKGSKHVGGHRIHVGENASLRHSMVTLGGDVVRIRMDQTSAARRAT